MECICEREMGRAPAGDKVGRTGTARRALGAQRVWRVSCESTRPDVILSTVLAGLCHDALRFDGWQGVDSDSARDSG